jgi:diguanylate cyclase (GGDEF)-like protein
VDAQVPPNRAGPSRAYMAYALSWLGVGLVLLVASVPRLAAVDLREYLVFALLAFLGNAVVVRFPSGTVVSMQAPFAFAAVWLFGWPAAPPVNFASAALLPLLHRVSPWRAVIFAGNGSLGMCTAGLVFWSVAGGPLRPDSPPLLVAVLVGAGAVFSLVNTTAAVLGRFLETGQSTHLSARNLLPLAGFTVLTYTPVSYLLAVAFRLSLPVFALTVSVWLLVGLTLQAYHSSRDLRARLEQATRELERLSTTDALTELLNRRVFVQVAERELARHRRYGDPVSLVLLDLRGFKRVNDTQGHQAGDAVLRWVAHVLRRRIRNTDTAFRLGGDEFAVLLPGTGLSGALSLAESLYRALRSEDGLRGADVTLGVASCPEHGCTVDELVRAADRALYRAREEGKWVGAAEVTGSAGRPL